MLRCALAWQTLGARCPQAQDSSSLAKAPSSFFLCNLGGCCGHGDYDWNPGRRLEPMHISGRAPASTAVLVLMALGSSQP